jgi:hypothetical protein
MRSRNVPSRSAFASDPMMSASVEIPVEKVRDQAAAPKSSRRLLKLRGSVMRKPSWSAAADKHALRWRSGLSRDVADVAFVATLSAEQDAPNRHNEQAAERKSAISEHERSHAAPTEPRVRFPHGVAYDCTAPTLTSQPDDPVGADRLSGQQVVPGGHVCSGFFSLLGRAVLPVTSPAAGRDWAGAAVLCDVGGAQFAPTGQVASGFCSFEGLGVAVWADAAPAANTDAVMMMRRSLGIVTSHEVHVGN